MPVMPSGGWWSRNLWLVVLFPTLAAVVLVGVGLFKGWLHRRVGFDPEGRPINGSVPKPPPPKPRTVVSAGDAYRLLVADLKRRDPEDRPRFRYLSLVHRHNDPGCTEAELDAERQAVRDLVALLGPGKPAVAQAIDPEQLLLRIDLEDLGWNAVTDWHSLASHYPYGLSSAGDDPLSKLRQQASELTQDPIPVVRADWLVAALTRPPLAGPKGLLQKPTSELPEAVRTLSRQYLTQTLDLAGCARELGLEDSKELADLIRGQDRLKEEFGLAPLLRDERIRREWWESNRNLVSPYQEVARLLKVGNPVRVQ